MTAATAQRLAALESANDLRSRRADLRRELAVDPSRLAGLIMDPPEMLHGLTLLDVLMLPSARRAHPPIVARLGMLAMVAGVNLLATIETAPVRSRRWLVDNARWRVLPTQRRLQVGRARPSTGRGGKG